jgi:hypothetical protein
MLAGQIGWGAPKNERIWLGVNLCLMAIVLVVAIVTGRYGMFAALVIGVVLLPWR